ncbi:MAG: sigma-70 family RNA polymerase sigma factor [Bacteroidaceae bacterium]|nr:sigma-70 family RNA polymerase sigma factor [Bacteroidaceae bacterium]
MAQQDFQHIAAALRPRLLKLCARFFDSQELAYEAEDAVQETLLRLWQQRDKVDGGHKLEAFAMLIAKNVCIDIMKRGGTLHDTLDECLYVEADNHTDHALMEHEAEKRLLKALDRLPVTQRKMLLMRSEGMSMAEIASACNTTTTSTKTMVCAARKRIMELLKN